MAKKTSQFSFGRRLFDISKAHFWKKKTLQNGPITLLLRSKNKVWGWAEMGPRAAMTKGANVGDKIPRAPPYQNR